jgi:hypothetical protein
MASTYSPLKIELIGTGEQVAAWGQTTNTNLGTAIEQAIGGKADVTMSSTSVTLTLTDTNAFQDARALYLNLTGTPGGAATLNVPAVQKAYIVRNGTTGGFAVTVKVTGQTGVSVPNGATMHLYNNGTDVVNAVTNLPSGATVGGVAIGTGGGTVTSVSGTGTVNGLTLTGTVTSSGSLTLGGTLSNVNLASSVTGTLPVANGGTGQTSFTAGTLLKGAGGSAITGLTGSSNGQVAAWNSATSEWLPTSTLLIGNGTVTVPSLAAAADTNTGIYFPAADTFAVAIGGNKAFEVVPAAGLVPLELKVNGGLVTVPDVTGTFQIGRYDSINGGSTLSTIGGSTFLVLQVEQSPKMNIMSNGRVGIGTASPTSMLHVVTPGNETMLLADNGSATTAIVSYALGDTAFVSAPATNRLLAIGTSNDRSLRFVTNSAERMRISNNGDVGIGTTSAGNRLEVKGLTADSTASAFGVQNSSSTTLFLVRNDGVINSGVAAGSPYNNTTGSAANVHVDSNGILYRSTSSIRYKKDVTDYDKGLNAVMALRPIYYKHNRTYENTVAGDQTYAGLIAEEVHAAGLNEFVQYSPNNEPDALAYGNMVALLTKAIQELKAELDTVKAELAAMKGN